MRGDTWHREPEPVGRTAERRTRTLPSRARAAGAEHARSGAPQRVFSTLRIAVACGVVLTLGGCAHVRKAPPADAAQPLTAEQLLSIASAAEQLGDRLRAQQYLSAARRAGANPELVLRRSLRLYVADGQYRIAIDSARDHLRSHPQQARLRLLLAQLYEATDLDAQALEEYERVLEITPSEPRVHFALATLLHERGHDPARADQHYRAYLELAPQGPDAAEARSHLLQELP